MNKEPFLPPVLEGQPAFPAVGVYFNMDEETYHGIHALSASGIKKMSASSMDYWASSVLNPDREERQTTFFNFGKAIHCFVLEGEEAYNARYAIGFEKETFEGLLDTIPDIKAAIVKLGVEPVKKSADDKPAKKEDWVEQLLDLDADAPIWDAIIDRFEKENEGKEIITAKIDRRVRIAVKMICEHQGIGPLFKGGYPEVSVFWHCETTGAPMKARFDYLKLRALVDLKSFANQNGKPVDRAIESTIANYRYTVQHVVYDEALAALKRMIKQSSVANVAHDADPTKDHFLRQLAEEEEPAFVFVFQQTGIAPVTRGKIMPRGMVYEATRSGVTSLKLKWLECAKTFGADPWLDLKPIEEIADEELPMWASDI